MQIAVYSCPQTYKSEISQFNYVQRTLMWSFHTNYLHNALSQK